MPKYTFICPDCNNIKQTYISVKKSSIDCDVCGGLMNRSLPNIGGIQTNELHDKYTNKSLVQDHKEIVNERKQDYYWSVEVPKMVNSGVYELETMLEKGWVYYDEKGQLVTRTKPPQKS